MASSGNALYLICEPCSKNQEKDFGFKLAARNVIGRYTPYGPAQATKQLTAWFGKHANCGGKGNPDHFVLGHRDPRNSDQPKLQIVNSIHGALQ